MSTNTNNTVNTNATVKSPNRPACYTKLTWERATYSAYMSFIAMVKGELSMKQYLTKNAELFKACGVPADGKHLTSLIIAMAKDTTIDHEKCRKVSSITTMRQFFNKTWKEKDSYNVRFVEPKAPKADDSTKSKKAKQAKVTEQGVTEWFNKMTESERKAFVAKLMGEAA